MGITSMLLLLAKVYNFSEIYLQRKVHTKLYIHVFEEAFCSLFIIWKSHIFLCRFIRMSSPKFNNITVVGCLLCYAEVLVSAYSSSASATHDSSLCYVSPFLHLDLFWSSIVGLYGIEELEGEKEEGPRARSEGNVEEAEKGFLSLSSLFFALHALFTHFPCACDSRF